MKLRQISSGEGFGSREERERKAGSMKFGVARPQDPPQDGVGWDTGGYLFNNTHHTNGAKLQPPVGWSVLRAGY